MRDIRTGPRFTVGLPVAIAGSLAVAFTGPAAAAAEPEMRFESRTDTRGLTMRVLSSSTPATYVVKEGDTVSGIASRHGVRTRDVLAWNGLSMSSVIHPGQVLKLRAAATAAPAPAKPATKTVTKTTTSYKTHVVRAGDTMSAIAKRSGISTEKLLAVNKLSWSSIIYPGQKVRIPVTKTVTTTVPAAPVAKAAPAAKAKAAAPSPKASSSAKTHTVRSGDTVSGIAAKHGVSVKAVLNANGLGWSSIIYPGQKLALPGAAAPAKAATQAAKKAPAAASGSGSIVKLDAEQTRNAKLIIKVGRQLGVPERAIAIALGTSMQESWLRNLDWGDRDSLGLFQQRPSTGWGTAAQIRNAERSIRVFYGGPKDPNGSRTRGLLDIRGWQKMSFAQAAQAVQISAYPDRYARWEDDAKAWLKALG